MAIKKKDIYGKVKPREDLFTRKKSKAKPVITSVLALAAVALLVVGMTKIPWADMFDGLGGTSASNGGAGTSQSQEGQTGGENAQGSETPSIDLSKIPEYSGEPYVELNGNKPVFSKAELSKGNFVTFAKLDSLGRVGTATAVCGPETVNSIQGYSGAEEKPTGWMQVKSENIYGDYLYSCRQLIGTQLTGEAGGEQNQITATQHMTSNGIWNYENQVADYIRNTGNHVAYRVTPVFEGKNLLASGVQIEAYSIEDKGETLSLNVYCYNVQPGFTLDYATGASY